ncbi:fibronectin type III domain-containing protein [Methylomagnum ishizawai]|uniref:fibronectin type III domain-containing protein n=1 Tax=Methylomagnum ishizawai TaxID=1760988 RepID=UPI001C32F125|nr:fibronectin type III domain-containing protein [Methylomagnum ishizawai]BBL75182.1 hypothetical protein MishRS11D_22800 [Methylomagnum ishizawai]
MQPKLIVAFDRLSEADFLAKADFIVASLTNNAAFPEPWPAQAPALSDIKEALNAYRDAYHASLTRDTLKIAQREKARDALTLLLKRLPAYLELVAQGDTAVLATTGYDLRRDTARTGGNGILDAPADFRVAHGQVSGNLEVRAARVAGARSYEVQTAQGDPTIDANWKHALSSATCSHIVLEGMVPAQTYWVRLRAIGSQGAGIWAEPVNIIVV